VEVTDTFHPQVVVTAKLYFPAMVEGLCPPPPSPVWLVRFTALSPFFVLVNTKVPLEVGVWQSKFHVVVHALGKVTDARTLSPVPDWVRYFLGAATVCEFTFGADEFDPQAAARVARSARPTMGTPILDERERNVPVVVRWCLKLGILMDIAFRHCIGLDGSHPSNSIRISDSVVSSAFWQDVDVNPRAVKCL